MVSKGLLHHGRWLIGIKSFDSPLKEKEKENGKRQRSNNINFINGRFRITNNNYLITPRRRRIAVFRTRAKLSPVKKRRNRRRRKERQRRPEWNRVWWREPDLWRFFRWNWKKGEQGRRRKPRRRKERLDGSNRNRALVANSLASP